MTPGRNSMRETGQARRAWIAFSLILLVIAPASVATRPAEVSLGAVTVVPVVDGFAGMDVVVPADIQLSSRLMQDPIPEVEIEGGGDGIVGFRLDRRDDPNDGWTVHRGVGGASGYTYSAAMIFDEDDQTIERDRLAAGPYRLSVFSTDGPARLTLRLPLTTPDITLAAGLDEVEGGVDLVLSASLDQPGLSASPASVEPINSYDAGRRTQVTTRLAAVHAAWVDVDAVTGFRFWSCYYDLSTDVPRRGDRPDPGCSGATLRLGVGATQPMLTGQGAMSMGGGFRLGRGDFVLGQSVEFNGFARSAGHYHVWIDTTLPVD